jgi:hypothetical protein
VLLLTAEHKKTGRENYLCYFQFLESTEIVFIIFKLNYLVKNICAGCEFVVVAASPEQAAEHADEPQSADAAAAADHQEPAAKFLQQPNERLRPAAGVRLRLLSTLNHQAALPQR